MFRMLFICLLCVISLSMSSCALRRPPTQPTGLYVQLYQGKCLFNKGFYKRAMRALLPLACDGEPQAQYAVGYMYYYGLGVAQDTYVGYFWINRSANSGYYPAIEARNLIDEGVSAKG